MARGIFIYFAGRVRTHVTYIQSDADELTAVYREGRSRLFLAARTKVMDLDPIPIVVGTCHKFLILFIAYSRAMDARGHPDDVEIFSIGGKSALLLRPGEGNDCKKQGKNSQKSR